MAWHCAWQVTRQSGSGEAKHGEARRGGILSMERREEGDRSGMARLAGARGGEHFLAVVTAENL